MLRKEEYTEQVDMWALGVIAYMLCVGRHPFMRKGLKTEDLVLSAEVSFDDDSSVPEACKDFIRRCLEKKPSERMTVVEALEHGWIGS